MELPMQFEYSESYYNYLDSLKRLLSLKRLPNFIRSLLLKFFLEGFEISGSNSATVWAGVTLFCEPRDFYFKLLLAMLAIFGPYDG